MKTIYVRGIVPFAFLLVGLTCFVTIYKPVEATDVSQYQATGLDGKVVSLQDFKGKAILLNTWATWCGPCRQEMPYLESLDKNFSNQGLVIVGVSIDSAGSDNKILGFMKYYGITYPILKDPDNRFSHVFSTMGVPETFLISQDGTILYHWKGQLDPTSGDVENRIKNALGQNVQLITSDNSKPIGITVAFLAGLLSFLSPCVLPLIPAYVSFITGMSLKELSNNDSNNSHENNTVNSKIKMITVTRGSLFVLGFSTIFVVLGSTVAFVGSLFSDSSIWIERIGGVVVILFGLNLLGILRIPWLQRQATMDISKRSTKNVGAFFVGVAFGAGWTPCIGPILAGILTLAAASTSATTGMYLLISYSAGLAIPFILSAFAIDRFLTFLQKIKKWIGWIERISGLLLISMGILLLAGLMTILSSIFSNGLTNFGQI
jgi:cytochrome c-type biogenesis protein